MAGSVYRTLNVVLTANVSSFTGGMASAARTIGALDAEMKGVNAHSVSASKGLDGVGKSAQNASKGAAVLKLGLAGIGIGAVLGLAAATKATVDFDKNMRNVTSLLRGSGESAQQVQQQYTAMSATVLSLAKTLPQGPNDLAKGLYDVVSAGFEANDALTILRVSATAASAGLSTTADATQAITGVINAYGYSANQAQAISDVLFQTVNVGVVTFSQLAQGLGEVIAVAAAGHVPIQQVGAAIATATRAGVAPAEAFTGLTRTIQAILNPSAQLAKTFHEMGYASGQAALAQRGLSGVIQDLQKQTNGSVVAIDGLFNDVRAQRTIFALMSNDGKLYASVLAQVADGNTAAGATARALSEQQKSVAFQGKLFVNTIEASAIALGQKLAPATASSLGGLTRLSLDGISGVGRGIKELTPAFRAIGDDLETIGRLAGEVTHDVAPLAEAFLALGGASLIEVLRGVTDVLADLARLGEHARPVVDALVVAIGVRYVAAMVASRSATLGAAAANALYNTAANGLASRSVILGAAAEKAADGMVAAKAGASGFGASMSGLGGLVNPVTLAVAGLAASYELYASGQRAAKAQNDSFAEALGREGTAAQAASGQIIVNALAHARYQQVLRATGTDEQTLIQGIQGSKGALDDVYASIVRQEPAIQKSAQLQGLLRDALQGNTKAAQSFSEATAYSGASSGSVAIAGYVSKVSDLASSYDKGADAAKKAADANKEFADAAQGDVSGLNDIAIGAGAADQNIAALSATQKEFEQDIANFTSPKDVFSKLVSDQTEAANAATRNTKSNVADQKKAITDQTSQQVRDLQLQKQSITNHTAGAKSEIDKQINDLKTKSAAEKAALKNTQDTTSGQTTAVSSATVQQNLSLSDFIAGLNKSNAELKAWEDNLKTILAKAGPEVAAAFAKLGPDGAALTAKAAQAGTDQMTALASAIHQQSGLQSAGVADDLAKYGQIAQAKASLGVQATADAIAKILGISVEEVNRIVANYGIALGNAANPILSATGQPTITFGGGRGDPKHGASGHFADGGIEDHSAQIASGGPVRVWAEPETGGEAYIPLHPSKRDRSIDIWQRTGELLGLSGGSSRAFAGGGFSGVNPPPKLKDFLVANMGSGVMNSEYQGVVALAQAQNASATGGSAGAAPQGQVVDWIRQAEAIAGWPDSYTNGLYQLIMHESGGNPSSINLWDSNAKAGHPSQGLMQTIPSTFNAYAFPGHKNITNPIDNILAGTAYALKNYGPGMVIAGGRHDSKGQYLGYDSGGTLLPGVTMAYNGTGKPEHVLTDAKFNQLIDAVRNTVGRGGNQIIIQGADRPVEIGREVRRALA